MKKAKIVVKVYPVRGLFGSAPEKGFTARLRSGRKGTGEIIYTVTGVWNSDKSCAEARSILQEVASANGLEIVPTEEGERVL